MTQPQIPTEAPNADGSSLASPARDGKNRPMAATVLVIEDEEDIRELIRYNLEREGFRVIEAASGEEALPLVRSRAPDLILLDLMLPGIQGLEVCRRIRGREETAAIPLIMVTARGEEPDVVAGLELGADDFVPKPFSPRELVARIRSVLRRGARAAHAATPVRRVGPLEIDTARHEVRAGGEPLQLTLAEFRLLAALAGSPGRVYTRAQLVREITGGEYHIVERNVDVHVRALRKKLGDAGGLIGTVRGVGYKIEDQSTT